VSSSVVTFCVIKVRQTRNNFIEAFSQIYLRNFINDRISLTPAGKMTKMDKRSEAKGAKRS